MTRLASVLVFCSILVPGAPVAAKDTVTVLLENRELAEDEGTLTEAIKIGKARFVSLMGFSASGAATALCSFTTEPASVSVANGPSGVPNLLAVTMRLLSIGYVMVEGVGTIPPPRVPVQGPFFQCTVTCTSGPCTGVSLSAFLSRK